MGTLAVPFFSGRNIFFLRCGEAKEGDFLMEIILVIMFPEVNLS